MKMLLPRLFLLATALLSSTAQAQSIDARTLSDRRVTVLDLGQPADAAKTPGKTFFAATIMNAPLQQLCAIIQDYPQYPQFMPNTAQTRIVQANADGTFIDLTLSLPLGKTKKYRLQMDSKTSEQFCRLRWKLVPSGLRSEETIADTTGFWQLTPLPDDNRKTVVEYQVYADPGPVPFGLGWIVDFMSRQSLPRTLEALRERAGVLQPAVSSGG